jgi:hypothetical protein
VVVASLRTVAFGCGFSMIMNDDIHISLPGTILAYFTVG